MTSYVLIIKSTENISLELMFVSQYTVLRGLTYLLDKFVSDSEDWSLSKAQNRVHRVQPSNAPFMHPRSLYFTLGTLRSDNSDASENRLKN